MAREYIENKSQRNKGLDGLARGIEHPVLKIVNLIKKTNLMQIFKKIACLPKCDDVRLKVFYMLALKKAAIKRTGP